jgi:hypothetical protein
MIVIAGDDHDLTPGQRASKLLEKWTRGGKRVAARAMAQLEHISEQDKSIDAIERVDQCGARTGATQHIGAGARAKMQI